MATTSAVDGGEKSYHLDLELGTLKAPPETSRPLWNQIIKWGLRVPLLRETVVKEPFNG
jgi:hypothetical protein